MRHAHHCRQLHLHGQALTGLLVELLLSAYPVDLSTNLRTIPLTDAHGTSVAHTGTPLSFPETSMSSLENNIYFTKSILYLLRAGSHGQQRPEDSVSISNSEEGRWLVGTLGMLYSKLKTQWGAANWEYPEIVGELQTPGLLHKLQL
jgi:hypothetical protein